MTSLAIWAPVSASARLARSTAVPSGSRAPMAVHAACSGRHHSDANVKAILLVNLPSVLATNASRIAWTILGADFLVDLELSALQTENRGEVISTPRVVTANGKQAVGRAGP